MNKKILIAGIIILFLVSLIILVVYASPLSWKAEHYLYKHDVLKCPEPEINKSCETDSDCSIVRGPANSCRGICLNPNKSKLIYERTEMCLLVCPDFAVGSVGDCRCVDNKCTLKG